MTDRPRLLLLDGHSLAYRAFFALPVENFSTSTGQPTNAVYGFTSMLINTLRDEKPTHVAVAFDVSRETFRTAEYPEYKATRRETPTDFKGQVALIEEVLGALAIPSLKVDGYEADDVIATLAAQATAAGFDVAIITGDRDAFQLVDSHVTVLYPRKGVSDLARMTPAAVEEKYGLTPTQYPDFAALRGDPSDNLPGIPGVGEKTATKWLHQFGSLDQLVARADEVPGKVGAALREHLAQVVQNRRLTELVRDVPLPVAVADLDRRPYESEAVQTLFDSLEFRVLRERLGGLTTTTEPTAEPVRSVELSEVAAGGLAGWLATHAGRGSRSAVAVRGAWGRGGGQVDAVAIAAGSGAVVALDATALAPPDDAALAAWLEDDTVGKVMHDAKGPMHALRDRGWPLRGLRHDTALSAYLVRPDRRTYELADLVRQLLNQELAGDAAEHGQLELGDDDSRSREELATVARAVLDLSTVMDGELERVDAAPLLVDLELPLLYVLLEVEHAGIAVDEEFLDRVRADLAGAVKKAVDDAFEAIGHEVNLGSPKQLQVVLFEELQLPKTKRIKTGYTTDAEALAWLHGQTEHPFLEALLRHRDASKLLVTVEGLQRSVSDDGRIHTTFNQTVAATGRLSSADPNLQNIPIRTDAGKRIRGAFVVGDGFQSLMTADYSQVEMRIMAHLSEDAGLIAAFASGEDLHTTVASRVFGVDPAHVDAEMRSKIKAMSYGLAYGLSAYGLSQQLGIGADEARALMDEYFERFGGVRDYLATVVDEARRLGYTQTLLGRRRYLPDLTSDNRQRREMAERMALNAPIQGSAADIVKVAMLGVHRALHDAGLRSRMLLQVHDELVLEVAPGERDDVEEIVRREMAGAAELRVPLDVTVGVGRSWESAAH